MGILQCDDGNLIDGDGCSSKCTIELNYECSGGNTRFPDTCKKITPPKATFTASSKTRSLVLEFDTPVKIPHNCNMQSYIFFLANFWTNSVHLTLENTNKICNFNWSTYGNLTKTPYLTTILFNFTITCSLSGAEIFVLAILKPNKIIDIWGNKFQQTILQAKAFEYFYMSESEAAIVAGAGSSFSLSSLATFAIVAVALIFQYFSNILKYIDQLQLELFGILLAWYSYFHLYHF